MHELSGKYKELLKKYWGHDSFRYPQEEIILSIDKNKDTLGLMPTAGGKSVTFQLPALMKEGVCIVITPLISLMNDQVEKLISIGIKAAAIHSGLSRHEMQVLLENTLYGAYKIVYLSPERLSNSDFRERLRHMKVSLIAVDEAHCISQWGYDFRPSYLQIAAIREIHADVPVLALTATATPEVVDDIQTKLRFKKPNVIQSDFSRSNLVYFVRHSESKMSDLIKVVKSLKGSGIIYVRSRKKTREISDQLLREGVSADFYHAGINYEVRTTKQINWQKNISRIMVATNAFGMGIDKSNVRFVIHVDFPDSLEEYFQEAGRAGRDGKKSFALLLTGNRDRLVLKKRITENFPEISFVKTVYNALSNFLRIPYAAGKGVAYDFNLNEFIKSYKLPAIQTFNALKLLEQQGYLELTDEMQNPSRVYFILKRDDLYRFQVENSKFDGFIKLVLRSYTGLFSDYVSVNEDTLAKRAGLTRDMVYQYFVRLSKMNVINYIPGRKTALVIFLEERLREKSVYISPENYHHRLQKYKKRLDAIENYAFNEETCRNLIMLEYFGQKGGNECGVCDVCKRKSRNFTHSDKQSVMHKITELLTERTYLPDDLAAKIKTDGESFSLSLKYMLDEELVKYNDQGYLVLGKTNS